MIEREDGKIGHSCSLSSTNAPLPTASTPVNPNRTHLLSNPTHTHTSTHTHYLVSAEPQTSRFICLISTHLRERGKNDSTFHRIHV